MGATKCCPIHFCNVKLMANCSKEIPFIFSMTAKYVDYLLPNTRNNCLQNTLRTRVIVPPNPFLVHTSDCKRLIVRVRVIFQ
jgi:hypothetical protein